MLGVSPSVVNSSNNYPVNVACSRAFNRPPHRIDKTTPRTGATPVNTVVFINSRGRASPKGRVNNVIKAEIQRHSSLQPCCFLSPLQRDYIVSMKCYYGKGCKQTGPGALHPTFSATALLGEGVSHDSLWRGKVRERSAVLMFKWLDTNSPRQVSLHACLTGMISTERFRKRGQWNPQK